MLGVDSRLALRPAASNFHIITKIPEKSSVIDQEPQDQPGPAEMGVGGAKLTASSEQH